MDVKEAIEEFKFFNEGDYITREMVEAKDVVLSELEKKEAIIDEMAEQLMGLPMYLDSEEVEILVKKEDVVEYFTKKCEGK